VLGKKYNIPVFKIDGDLKEYTEVLKELKPDFLLAIGWYYMIPKKMLMLAEKGAAGIHASLLPKYRGNAPLVWAMINGEKETGVSFFYFEGGVDEGDIIAQESFPIEESDTIKNLLFKTNAASKKILVEHLSKISKGTASRIKQDHSKASLFPKRSPEDGLIDWNWDIQRIKNFIRAQTKPYPGAYTIIAGKKIIIWDADVMSIDNQ
jgi:methionyl-tRNA formyltransferase